MRHRGFTLAELIVAGFILGLLLFAVFAIYRMGASTMMKADAQTELLQQLQTITTKLSREAERSVYEGVSVTPDGRAVALLDATYSDGSFAVDSSGRLVWQRYVIYYWEPAASSLSRTTLPYLPPDPRVADTLESYTGNPLSDYTNGGQEVGRNVSACTFAIEGGAFLRLGLEAQKKRYGREDPERLSLGTTVLLRN
ncbi:MAG: prepilin-type N-terminal cleavage/methylation domain-containing protein [Armatimonadetes bacterium]|nr:prepilin-type N-terminal cleavage/methylation domain-containing protein [Armatimonadota bacterium]